MTKTDTIRRDLADIHKRLTKARRLTDRGTNPEAWQEIDRAIGRVEGLGVYVSKDPNPADSEVQPAATAEG